MARTEKSGLDYFSHDTDLFEDRKIKFLKAKHKLIGYAVYMRLLENIYKENGYYLEFNERDLIMFSDENYLDTNLCNDIINICLDENLFDKALFNKYKILTSKRIQKNYLKGCEKRKSILIIEDYLLIDPFQILGEKPKLRVDIKPLNNINTINDGINGINDGINRIDSDINSQSKVKESKVKEIRVNESKREESKEHEIPSLLFNKKPSLTFYDYEPKDFNNDNELSEKIISLAQKYCGKFSLSPSEQSRFKNLIIKNENILKKDAFRILFDCFEQYPNLKPEQKNLPYLASQIQGKINDAVNLAPILEREKNAKDFKKQEYLETKKFSATNTNMTIDELVESVTLDDFISNAKKCDKNK